MKIDSGVELKFEKIGISDHLFADMEQIEKDMQKKMLESSKKEAESIAYALEHDRVHGILL